MKFGHTLGGALAFGILAFAGAACAQEAPAAATSGSGHASGLMLQGRLQAQSGLLSLGGGPSFLFGYQGPSFALGLGLGLNRIGVSAGTNDSASLTMLQLMPTAIVDVWHSADGRARANLVGGVGYGRISVNGTATGTTCTTDALGNQTCSNTGQDFSAGLSYVPFMLGFGGDYYLSRNFALGAEMGLQAAVATGVNTSAASTSKSVDASGNLEVVYGALRATFVLGD